VPLGLILPDTVRSKRLLYAQRRPQVAFVNAAAENTNRRSRSRRMSAATRPVPSRARLRDGDANGIESEPGHFHGITPLSEHFPCAATRPVPSVADVRDEMSTWRAVAIGEHLPGCACILCFMASRLRVSTFQAVAPGQFPSRVDAGMRWAPGQRRQLASPDPAARAARVGTWQVIPSCTPSILCALPSRAEC